MADSRGPYVGLQHPSVFAGCLHFIEMLHGRFLTGYEYRGLMMAFNFATTDPAIWQFPLHEVYALIHEQWEHIMAMGSF